MKKIEVNKPRAIGPVIFRAFSAGVFVGLGVMFITALGIWNVAFIFFSLGALLLHFAYERSVPIQTVG